MMKPDTVSPNRDAGSRQASWLYRVWDAFTAPSARLTHVDDRHKARLLASLLILLIPLGVGLVVLPPLVFQNYALNRGTYNLALAACGLLSGAYVLSRSRYYPFGTALALGTMIVAIMGSAFNAQDNSVALLTFLLLPIVLGSMLMSIRALTILIILCLLLVATSPLLLPGNSLIDALLGEFSLILLVSIMLVMLLDYRARVEYQRLTDLEAEVEARTRELRRIKERAEVILASAPDPMLLIRADGYIETGNDAFVQMFGYRPNEIDGLMLTEVISPESRVMVEESLKISLSTGQSIRREVAVVEKHGKSIDTDLALAPLHVDGQIAGVVCSLRDISTLKEVERMKDAFVSNVSHELRTPITSLKLYHQLLVMNPNKYQDYVSSLQREMYRLERIVEDLLLLSRLDQRRVAAGMSATDLNALIRDFITDREMLATERGLTLRFVPQPDLPRIMGDRSLLGQILSILVTNALNYTPAGGKVQVTTHTDVDHPGMAAFSVCDTGPGIPLDERDQLFTRFFRGKISRAVNAPGTGLGLAIAREIVDLHHGQIGVNAPDAPCMGEYSGAMFTVWLPVADGP